MNYKKRAPGGMHSQTRANCELDWYYYYGDISRSARDISHRCRRAARARLIKRSSAPPFAVRTRDAPGHVSFSLPVTAANTDNHVAKQWR